MPDERTTLTNAIRREVKKRQGAGQPVWGRKLHGSMYQRDLPDWLFCIGGLFIVIETKHPDGRRGTTVGQDTTLQAIAKAGGRATVCLTIDQVRRTLDQALDEAQAIGAARRPLGKPAAATLEGHHVWPRLRVRVLHGTHAGAVGHVVETDHIDNADEALVAMPDGQRVWFAFNNLADASTDAARDASERLRSIVRDRESSADARAALADTTRRMEGR